MKPATSSSLGSEFVITHEFINSILEYGQIPQCLYGIIMAEFWNEYLLNVTASVTASKFKWKLLKGNKIDRHQSVTFVLFYNTYT